MNLRLADLPGLLQDPDVIRQLLASPSATMALIHYQGATYTLIFQARPDLEDADYSHWPRLGER